MRLLHLLFETSKHQCLIIFKLIEISVTQSTRQAKALFNIPPLRLQLHGAIYRPDSFVLMLRYCANLEAIRYESTGLNRIVADKSHRVIVV